MRTRCPLPNIQKTNGFVNRGLARPKHPALGRVEVHRRFQQPCACPGGVWRRAHRPSSGAVAEWQRAPRPSFSPLPVAPRAKLGQRGVCHPATGLRVRHWAAWHRGRRPIDRHRGVAELAKGSASVVEASATRRPGKMSVLLLRASTLQGGDSVISTGSRLTGFTLLFPFRRGPVL